MIHITENVAYRLWVRANRAVESRREPPQIYSTWSKLPLGTTPTKLRGERKKAQLRELITEA